MRKIVIVAALVASTHAYACCDIPSPNMGQFFQSDQDPLSGVRDAARNLNDSIQSYQPRQTHCRSVQTFGGWTTDCD